MSLQGPLIVVCDDPISALTERLTAAGASPVVEARRHEFATKLAAVRPAAIILIDGARPDQACADALRNIAAAPGAFTPIIACVRDGTAPAFAEALPVAADGKPELLIARLRSALRVRTLHSAVLHRIEAFDQTGGVMPDLAAGDALDDATVLVAGRGRAYPALTIAVGGRMGLIGALSLETAMSFLNSRDVDGIVIGDGFGRRMVEGFLVDLGADARFRDLPIAVLDHVIDEIDAERLPNLDRVVGEATLIADRLSPSVRVHAFAARLRRMMASLDGKGTLDPDTGLRTGDAFMHDLVSAIADAEDRGAALSLARISLENLAERRASLDAARIVGRLVRHADFACRDIDGTILIAFVDTDLRIAHVVARRIASVLLHTTLAPGQDRRTLDPTVAIAALKQRDTAATLIARVTPDSMVAAS